MKEIALTRKENSEIKDIPIHAKMVVFLIGGAGDKRSYMGSGPNNNIVSIYDYLNKKISIAHQIGQVDARLPWVLRCFWRGWSLEYS